MDKKHIHQARIRDMSMTGKHVLKAYLHDLVRAFLIYEPEVALKS